MPPKVYSLHWVHLKVFTNDINTKIIVNEFEWPLAAGVSAECRAHPRRDDTQMPPQQVTRTQRCL